MKDFAVIDCETDPFKEGRIAQPFLWGYYSKKDGYEKFDNVDDLFEYLKGRDLRIYAHNGGKFDFHYMLHKIPDWQKVIVINGRLARFKIDDLEFNDSYCILPVPLAAYQKTKIDYSIFERELRDIPENRAKIESYLEDDCKFLYELIEAFIEENGYSLTIASCAIKKLQKIENFKIPDSGKEFFDAIRPYYYGGRVECFTKGIVSRETHYYDINSAYPYAMTFEHPVGDFITTYEKSPKIEGHNFYKFQAVSIGAFPFRSEDNSLYFPNDGNERVFCVTGWELLQYMAFYPQHKCKHIEQKIFFETRNFSRYVNHYYTIKATSKKGSPENIFAKLFLNSAYGKFAANPEKYVNTYLCPLDDFEKAVVKGFNIHGEIHNRLIISKENNPDDWRFYNVATGASITGFVRAYLYRALHNVERPVYCDTDSIVFMGSHNLSCGNELGRWKHEGDFIEGGIGGKKIYAFKDKKGNTKTACKGLILNYDEIIEVCKGKEITKTPEAPIYSIKKGIYFLKKTIAMT